MKSWPSNIVDKTYLGFLVAISGRSPNTIHLTHIRFHCTSIWHYPSILSDTTFMFYTVTLCETKWNYKSSLDQWEKQKSGDHNPQSHVTSVNTPLSAGHTKLEEWCTCEGRGNMSSRSPATHTHTRYLQLP